MYFRWGRWSVSLLNLKKKNMYFTWGRWSVSTKSKKVCTSHEGAAQQWCTLPFVSSHRLIKILIPNDWLSQYFGLIKIQLWWPCVPLPYPPFPPINVRRGGGYIGITHSTSCTIQPFLTRLGMVVYHHEVECHEQKLVHYLHCEGHSEGLWKAKYSYFLWYLLNSWSICNQA